MRVAIIGAGFGGIGAAIALRKAGHTDFVVLERATAVGGTWRDNSYPGCTCDVPSHLYSFSFAPNPDWTRSFSRQAEIWDYLERVTDRYGLRGSIRFEATMTEARWDASRARWRIRTSRGDLTADVLVSAAGPLSAPALPDIPGLASFPGPVFHSAQWNHDFDLAGKRVAVVGTGASAIQIVPEIQPRAGRLVLFQRTPAWVMPRRDRKISEAEKWLYRHVPLTQRAARLGIYLSREPLVGAFVKRPQILRAAQRIALGNMAKSITDPDLRAKLTPDYVMGCKRILLSNDYYPALAQPNVDVVAAGLAKVDGSTLTAQDGTSHDVDAIAFATGFRATDVPIARHIYGAAGVSLAEAWNRDMRALRGTTVPGFPNLCLMIGPNTGLGHNSMVHIIESQLSYIADYLATLDRTGAAALDARPAARGTLVRRHRAADGVHGLGHRRLRELVPQRRGTEPDALAGLHDPVPPRHPPPGPGRVRPHPGAGHLTAAAGRAPASPPHRVSTGQNPPGIALAEVPPDPDMCVHLCPGLGPGAVDALGAGLAAGVDDSVVDEVLDDACDEPAPDVELVEALAMVSPNASVAPSAAAPTAVPMRGLVILTRFSLLVSPWADPGDPPVPVGQAQLTGSCADLLSPR